MHQHLVGSNPTTPCGATLPGLPVSSLLLSLSPSSSVSSLHPDTARREVPASLRAALDRTQKKACQLLLEELLLDLQVRLSTAREAGRAATNPVLARTALLLHPEAWVYSCPGSLLHTLWPAIILQTSLLAWLPDLDKPQAAQAMSVTSEHRPVSLGQMACGPRTTN